MMNKKNILITGSSRGIGLETAKYFSADYNVYITGRYSEKLEKLCTEYNFSGFFAVDLTDNSAAEQLYKGLNVDIIEPLVSSGANTVPDAHVYAAEAGSISLKYSLI